MVSAWHFWKQSPILQHCKQVKFGHQEQKIWQGEFSATTLHALVYFCTIAYSTLFAPGVDGFINWHLPWFLLLSTSLVAGSHQMSPVLVLFPLVVCEQHLLLKLQPHAPSEL